MFSQESLGSYLVLNISEPVLKNDSQILLQLKMTNSSLPSKKSWKVEDPTQIAG